MKRLDIELATEAKAIVALAFRNGPIEGVHAGKVCPVCHGVSDYSHITDDEMRVMMKSAVNVVYKLLWDRDHDLDSYQRSWRVQMERGCSRADPLDAIAPCRLADYAATFFLVAVFPAGVLVAVGVFLDFFSFIQRQAPKILLHLISKAAVLAIRTPLACSIGRFLTPPASEAGNSGKRGQGEKPKRFVPLTPSLAGLCVRLGR